MSRYSRREFLEMSLMTASAALAVTAMEDARAAEGPVNTPAPGSPNDAIMIGVIGVKNRGLNHVDGYLGAPGATVAAICDVDLAMAERAAKRVEEKTGQRPRIYQDLRKLYEDREIDAVSMALPIHWHALASIWAMQAGKDVYVEKPVCHNLFEGRQMVNAARRYNRICQSGTQSRSYQATRDAVQYIHDGKIGKVHLARGLCYKSRGSIGVLPDGPVPAGVDYNIWLGPAPARPFNPNRFHYNWHWHWDYGSGDLGNQGIHQMDIARWALNEDRLPTSVMGLGGRFGYQDQGETPNTEIAWFDYGDQHLIFEVRGLKTPKLTGVDIGDIVYGKDGYVAFTSNYGNAGAFDNAGNKVMEFKGGGNHFRNFLDAVRSRRAEDLNAPIRDGYLSSALCHLGNISYRVGKPASFKQSPKSIAERKEMKEAFERMQSHLAENGVDLDVTAYQLGPVLRFDPNRERFRDHRQANALLSREYRRPFVVPERL
ncbi:MAG: Gfo/Idh/MocA family oxidoreductase [Armatimonadetes bacterium]|nr:Gfo/Idh/MocA family oxidoreductase [Armatimonadota bacterium]